MKITTSFETKFSLGQEVRTPGDMGTIPGIVVAILYRASFDDHRASTLVLSPNYLEGTQPNWINLADGIHYWVTRTSQWFSEDEIWDG